MQISWAGGPTGGGGDRALPEWSTGLSGPIAQASGRHSAGHNTPNSAVHGLLPQGQAAVPPRGAESLAGKGGLA